MKSYRKYVTWVFSNSKLALACCVILLVAAFVGASGISLKSDLQRLLPDAAMSVKGLKQLESEYADQLGRLTVVLEGGDTSDREAYAFGLLEQLGTVPDVDRAVSNPLYGLKDFRLLYVELDKLKKAREQLKKRIKWEKQRANPLFVSLKKEDPPPVDLEEEGDGNRNLDPFYSTAEKTFLFVHPAFPASDLDRTRKLVGEVERVVESTLPSGISYALTGRYAKRILQQELITQDVASASSIALLLLVLFLGIFFRSPRLTLIAILPLIAGTVLTGTIVVILFGSLNIITGFLAAVIMGLGVDYGIHFCAALRKSAEPDPEARWLSVLGTTGRANIYAGVTTAIAFGFLSFSSFRAFFEFGVIAFIGLLFVVACYFLISPILIAVFGLPRSGSANATTDMRFSSGSFAAAAVLIVVSVVVAAFGVSGVRFDRSFEYLQISGTPMHQLDQEVNEVLGVSQTPAVLLAENPAHEAKLIEVLEARKKDAPIIGPIIHGGQFIPSDLSSRRDVIRDILKDVDALPKRVKLTDKLQSLITEARNTVDKPLTKSDLPKALTTTLSRRSSGSVILVMPNGDLGEAAANANFAQSIRALPGPSPDAPVISALSEVQLLAEIMDLVQADIGRVVLLTVFAIFVIAFFALRFRNWIRFVVNTVVSMSVALAMLAVLDIPLNFMNSLVLPVCIGLAVDASFHMFAQIEKNPKDDAQHLKTMIALVGSFATSMIGFGSLVITVHPGLRSLGYSAIVALVAIALTNICLYRLWLRWE